MPDINYNFTLQFSKMRLLWRFAYKLNCKSLAINTKDNKLMCECSLEEMNAAVDHYGAKILKAFRLKSFVPTHI
jgi:hypothetical protein